MSTFGGFGGFGQNNNNNAQQNTGFGGGGFGASANNNNNTTGGFGAPANTGFGASAAPATGGSLFGSANNSTGGGFGGSGFGSNTASTGFGAARPAFGGTSTFGAPAAGTSTTPSLFGSGNTNTQPTTGGFGGGGFGSTAQNTSTGFGAAANTGGSALFGSSNNSTGFGGNNTANTGFGSSAPSGFGGTTATTGFGASANTGFGSSAQNQNQGTGGTPFQAHVEKDGPGNNQNSHYQSITFQQPYTNFSFEELRVTDYMQGRKYGNQNGQPGAFGAATGFGGQPASTGFGGSTTGTSMFGQPAASTTGGFGQPAATSGFGAPASTSTGMFGGPKPAPGLFGSSTTTPAANPLFGGNNNTQGGFGANTGTTGGFGANTNAVGMFGGSNNNQPKPLFGAPAPTTSTGFGAQPSSTGFGGSPANTGSMFGQSNNTNTSGFGAQSAPNNSSFGGFGTNNNTAQANPSPFGDFGANNNNNNAQKPLFGAPSTSLTFGNNNNNQASPSLFPSQTNAFGGPKPATSPFGGLGTTNNTGSTGMFGGLNNQQPQNAGGNMWGGSQNKSLFPSTNTGSTMFGGLGSNNNGQQQTGTMFNNTGNNNQAQLGTSMFGSSLLNNSQQSQGGQQLTTSIMAQNPYGNEHLFVSLANTPQAVGPIATPLSSSQKTRRPAPLPPYKINPAASTRLITPQKRTGYGFSYSTYGTPGSSFNSPALGQSLLTSSAFNGTLGRSASTSSLRNYGSGDSILSPGAFSASPMRNLGGSGGMRKLRIDRNIRTDLFGVDGSADADRTSPLKKIVSFQNETNNESNDSSNDNSTALVRTEEDNSAEPSAEEQGLLRSSRNGKDQATPPKESQRNEEDHVRGNELAIVPEDGSPPPPASRPTVSADDNIRLSQKDQRPGPYFMKPTRAELDKLSRTQLSNMKDFIVGREGVGHIVFHQTDLTAVNLDKICDDIVKLETRSATVYVGPQGKPPVGKGLNVPSTVTLGNSWPRATGGGLPVYERKGPRFDKHIVRLKRVVGTKFVEYKAERGEWVFDVDHFSTYALDYNDDFDMSVMDDSPNRVPDFRNSLSLPGAFDQDTDFDMTNAGYDSSASISNNGFNPSDSFFQTHPISQETHQDNETVDTVEFTAGSQDDEAVFSIKAPAMNPARVPSKSILKASTAHFGTPQRTTTMTDADWNEQLIRTISPKKQDRRLLRESQGVILKEHYQNKPTTSVLNREANPFATSIDVMNSLFGNNAGGAAQEKKQKSEGKGFQWPQTKRQKTDDTTSETDKAFHASFKPSWASNTTLADTADSLMSQQQSGLLVDTQIPLSSGEKSVKFADFTTSNEASRTFEKQKKLTKIRLERGVPFAQLDDNFTFPDLVESLGTTETENVQEKQMWELAGLLFDKIPENHEVNHDIARKEVVSEFWQKLVTSDALEQVKSASVAEEKALAYLSCFKLWDASEMLLNGKDFRLAAMISQIGGDEGSQQRMAKQIDEWKRTNVISEMSLPIRALYELLAGNTCVSEGKAGAGTENQAETFRIGTRFNLDWRRVFGLKLWYGTATMEGLSEAVAAYLDDLASTREKVKPLPPFVKPGEVGTDDERQDILWGLLKMFGERSDKGSIANLGDILSSKNLSANPIDSRLSFQLYQFLRARSIADFKPDDRNHKADLLATDYAFQLSSSEETSPTAFCDAVFITLHLTSPPARRAAITALLNRHAGFIGDSPSTCETFRTLATDLKIPTPWIWTAKALYSKAVLGDRATEVRCLLRAGEIREAHETLRRVVAPLAVIEEDLDGLRSLLVAFEEARATVVEGWQQGGGVYSDFAKLDVAKGKEEKETLMGRLEAVLPGMMKAGALEERAAVREMADVVERMRALTGNARPDPSMVSGSENSVYGEAVSLSDDYYARLGVAAAAAA